MLESVQVASPCSAEWSEMVGDDRVRFCNSCEKHVYNLSAMQAADAEKLLEERAGKDLCVRFYQRADGTVMTSDCPVGVTRKRRKKVAMAVAGAGAMAFGAFASLRQTTTMGSALPVTNAEIAVMGAAPAVTTPVAMGTAVPPVAPPRPMMGDIGPSDPKPLMGTAPVQVSPPKMMGKVAQGGVPAPHPVRPTMGRMPAPKQK